MKVHCKRWFFVIPWLIAAAAGLSAQEKPVLNADMVQNFIENLGTIDEAFSDMEAGEDFREFTNKMDEFQTSLEAYLYGGDDSFPAFRTAFIRVKSARAPEVEQVFSTFGLGQKGLEVFFVITLGMTIGLMESEIETVLSSAPPDMLDDIDLSELEEMQNKLVMMRSLIHPDDMVVVEKKLGDLLTLF
jgi:hypothetical protein